MIGKVEQKQSKIQGVNFRLILYTVALAVIGIFVVRSATANEPTTSLVSTTVKQIIGVAAGIVLMAGLMILDYHKTVKYSAILYLAAILLLLYLLLFVGAISGAKRWIHIPAFGTIQPSEFAKPALLVFLAFLVHKFEEKISKIYVVALFLAGAAPVLVLVLMEPDLSTAIVLFLILVSVLFLSGISYKWIIGIGVVLVPIIIFFIVAVYQPEQTILNSLLKPHQVERINGYFFPNQYPGIVYQQNNSVMAIGSGGFFGKGLNNSSLESVKNGSFLSEEQCDFIFAVIGEEMGFLGSVIVMILLLLISIECLRIAAACTDTVGRCIAGTVGAVIFLQSFINIGVATLLLPNTGIPLPFLSAGLSSLLSSFLMVGLALSVGVHGRIKRRVFY